MKREGSQDDTYSQATLFACSNFSLFTLFIFIFPVEPMSYEMNAMPLLTAVLIFVPFFGATLFQQYI